MPATTAQRLSSGARAEGELSQRNAASKFATVCELGHGGMADVYLAIARGPAGFNKLLVLKQIRQSFAEDVRFLQMLLDEARLSAQLNHPNIVQTYEVGIDAGRHYVAMEYLEGQSLSKLLRSLESGGRELSIALALRIAADALAGLHYAHELSDLAGKPLEITHCDVSPHNLFVTYEGQVKVLDFGLAKTLASSPESQSGMIRGKLYYMAPEQAAAEPVDRRADIFAMGVVLWELITGRELWRGQTDIAVACALRFGEIPRITTVARGLPKVVADICTKALAYRPEQRFQTAAEFRAALLAVLDELYPRTTNEELGALVSDLFAQQRSELRCVIEARVAELSEAPEPALAPAAPPSERRRRRVRALAFAPLALLFALGFGALVLRHTHTQTHPPPNVAAPARSPRGRAAAGLAHVEIRVPAEGARIYWDGRALEGNPFRGQLPRDGAVHHIRAEAPGYLASSTTVTLEHDVRIELPLARIPAPDGRDDDEAPALAPARTDRTPTRRARPTTPRKEREPTREPQPETPERAPLDFEDPWGGT